MFENIPQNTFEERTGITPISTTLSYRCVTSLRDIDPRTIKQVQVMPRSYLLKLLQSITLEGDPAIQPYNGCEVEIVQLDPRDIKIGQTFVQREKYQLLLERFGGILGNGFCMNGGIAQCGPLIVFGDIQNGIPALAHYVPPIIEATSDSRFLIDGIHRSFIVRSVGTTIESILIKNVAVPLPCDPISWEHIRIVEEKPARKDRFRNLRRHLFRNTKYAGIDG